MVTEILENSLVAKRLSKDYQFKDSDLFLFKGKSMFPFLREQDVLLVNPVRNIIFDNMKNNISNGVKNNGRIKPGDIIIYPSGQKLIAHRVVHSFKNDSRCVFIALGDNSSGLGELVNEQDIKGRLTGFIRAKKIYRLDRGLCLFINLVLAKISIFRYVTKISWKKTKTSYLKPFARLLLRNSLLKTIFSLLLNNKFKYEIFSLDGCYTLNLVRKNKLIAQVILLTPKTLDDTFIINRIWVWWPYRTLGVAMRLVENAEDLAKNKNIHKLEFLLYKNSFPAIEDDELLKAKFHLINKDNKSSLWRKETL